MSDDDDLFVVIVGDETECEPKWEFEHSIEIKQEVLEEEEDKIEIKIEKLLDTATEYGEVLELDQENFNMLNNAIDNNKFKPEYDEEYNINLKTNESKLMKPSNHIKTNIKHESDEDYVPSDHSMGEVSYILDRDTDDDHTGKSSKRNSKSKKKKVAKHKGHHKTKAGRKKTHFWKGNHREIVSYIKYLRNLYPDLKNDDELLINCLVEVMKQTRRPEPPIDYYVMNGIMLECIHCAYLSSSIPAAHRHYQEKHGERYLYCYACGVDFRSTTNLYKHEKRCDAPDIRIVLKARARSLGRKGRSRPFLPDLSDVPPKKYYKSVRQYHCAECSASFVSKNGLLSHERMHRGERPYACSHCPCAYTSRTTLSRHMQKHGSQEYICDHCKRSFKIKAALILHLDTHAPLKKFPCSECPKRYSQKSALLVHVNRDHRKLPQPFGCQICPKRYPRMSVLKEHMRKVHGMLIMTRKMFFKQLPVLTETQLQQAKVVLKSEDPYRSVFADDEGACDHDANELR